MRFAGWFCLVIGVVCLCAAAGLGILAIQQATQISAYHQARPCILGAASKADCLRVVDGTVAGVTEFPGSGRISAEYQLDIRTASAMLHLTFSADSPLLAHAVDGDPAVVTMWRGVPVSVATDGRSAVTTSVPATALARHLSDSEESGGIGMFFVLGALAIRRNRRSNGMRPPMRPVPAATVLALSLTSAVLAAGGFALGGKPSRLALDQTATGAALVVVLGFSVWVGLSVKRRINQSLASQPPTSHAREQGTASSTHDLHPPVLPVTPVMRPRRTPLRTRLHPARFARVLRTVAAAWLTPALTVGVLFGLFLTSHDGPAARAYRHAPACVGETNLATCAGDFTAVINGVRTPANGRNSAEVSYVTSDGAINAWGTFDGSSAVLARMAAADQNARTPLRIRVWHDSIIGAELGGSWHWTEGNPPGDMIPAVYLAISFAVLLLVVRLPIHRGAGRGTQRQRLLMDDVGQVAVATGSTVLLWYGFWPGAFLALGTLVWLGLSARQSVRRKRAHLAPLGPLSAVSRVRQLRRVR